MSKKEGVRWRAKLPSTGQGTPVVSGGRVFVTSHEEITEDSQTGSAILGMCFDADTGKELWRRKIGGTRKTDLSSLFSDNTAASPVTDGERVVFVNVGGTVKCFDYEGKELWSHTWTPFGRHHARAHEPILHDGKVILMHTPRYDLPVSATTKGGSHSLGRGKEYWTFLRAYDLRTGKPAWQAEAGTSVHSTSILGRLPDGKHAILTGRGGGAQATGGTVRAVPDRCIEWKEHLGSSDQGLCGGSKCKLGGESRSFLRWAGASLGRDRDGRGVGRGFLDGWGDHNETEGRGLRNR